MPPIPIPEDPIGHLHKCCVDVAIALQSLLRVDVNGAALFPVTEAYVDALQNLGQAMVALAVCVTPIANR